MDIDNRINQCKKDIELLTKQLNELETERQKYVPRNGDVVVFGDDISKGNRVVIGINGTTGSWKTYNFDGFCTAGGSTVENFYEEGQYKVLYNIFDKD